MTTALCLVFSYVCHFIALLVGREYRVGKDSRCEVFATVFAWLSITALGVVFGGFDLNQFLRP